MTERFLRIMIQLAVQHCLRSEAAAVANLPPGAPRPTALSFIAIDAAVRLFVCLITQHGGGPALLTKVCDRPCRRLPRWRRCAGVPALHAVLSAAFLQASHSGTTCNFCCHGSPHQTL